MEGNPSSLHVLGVEEDESPSTDAEWTSWIQRHTAQHCLVPTDYAMARMAAFLGSRQVAAHQLALQGADLEGCGDYKGAMRYYTKAYRQWASLDSILEGGVPVDVRKEAVQAGYLESPQNVLLDVMDTTKARASTAVVCASQQPLLSHEGIANLLKLQSSIYESQSPLENNPENQRHAHKQACMMNNPPHYRLQNQYPAIVGKLLAFCQYACNEGEWASPGGPLEHVPQHDSILQTLSIRVMELWEYQVGGGLTDPYHYDTDSVITLVALLSDPSHFDGGDFRTYELGDTHTTHPLGRGHAVAFCSHKYHNITPITRGCRKSLVMELWQGGVGHEGR